jgi:hypothetical protein
MLTFNTALLLLQTDRLNGTIIPNARAGSEAVKPGCKEQLEA